MTKKDEIINKLIKATGTEVDYWLLESNRAAREGEYGVKYEKIAARFRELRHHLLDAILALPETRKK